MALHRKLHAIDKLEPDIAVLPEIARPDVIANKASGFNPDLCLWAGRSLHKGLGVIAQSNRWDIEIDDSYDPLNSVVLPVRVRGPIDFNLLAIWSIHVDGKKPTFRTPGNVLRAIEASEKFCQELPLVVAGDFNNAVVWDKPGNMNNMAEIDRALRDLGLVSAYHQSNACDLGNELDSTLYWRDRKKDGPQYHIDYVYIPKRWSRLPYDLSVGQFDDWIGNGLSDHVPISLSFRMQDLLVTEASKHRS